MTFDFYQLVLQNLEISAANLCNTSKFCEEGALQVKIQQSSLLLSKALLLFMVEITHTMQLGVLATKIKSIYFYGSNDYVKIRLFNLKCNLAACG